MSFMKRLIDELPMIDIILEDKGLGILDLIEDVDEYWMSKLCNTNDEDLSIEEDE